MFVHLRTSGGKDQLINLSQVEKAEYEVRSATEAKVTLSMASGQTLGYDGETGRGIVEALEQTNPQPVRRR